MDIILISVVALFASLLTFYSGFGLGTLLLPAFAFVFPPELAITATGFVHLLNNLFKMALLQTHVDWKLLGRFGIPSIVGASLGAISLSYLDASGVFFSWSLNERVFDVGYVSFFIGILMVVFAIVELLPQVRSFQVKSRLLIPGGLISGFFGGLSGHQGALRSMFLIKTGIKPEVYIATGTCIACMVDLTRLSLYVKDGFLGFLQTHIVWVVFPVGAAVAGAIIGNRFLGKIRISWLSWGVGLLLGLLGLAMCLGIIAPAK